MKFRLVSAAVGAALTVSALLPTAASAATEFGDNCVADSGTSSIKYTLFGVSSASPFPLAAPSAGVITSWKLNLTTSEPVPAIIPQTLKVLRINPTAKTAQVIGEASGNVGSGFNTVPARISIQAGDRLGLFGTGQIAYNGGFTEVGTLYCEGGTSPTDLFGGHPGDAPAGGSIPYEESNGLRVPAVAVLEPDADGDGYGDETQDACPQSAAAQAACPVVNLSLSTSKGRKSVTVAITGTTAANVTVNGKVPLGKGKKAKLKGGTKAVTPGAFTKFKLKFPKKLIDRLEELPPSKKLTLKITSSAPNLAAAPTKKTIKVKLKGQG